MPTDWHSATTATVSSSSSFVPPPPMSIPPQGTTVPPHPGGNRHQVTVPPFGQRGGPYTTPGQPILVLPN